MKKFRIIKKYVAISRIRRFVLLAILLMANLSLLLGATDGEIITLNLGAPTTPGSFAVDGAKGQWIETYSNNYPYIQFNNFKLTHNIGGTAGTDVGGGMSYWDGFTYCTSGDQTDYGSNGSSVGWVASQWGCMAGGGIKTDGNGNVLKDGSGKVIAEQGVPYLVAYWGYYMEMFNGEDPCLRVHFNDGKSYEAVGVYICNHPWPYYGNIHGDGFARPFAEGDYFRLRIHGFNEQMEDIGTTVVHTLAEYKNGKLTQSTNWEWVDLSALGKVSGIYFTMETTDSDPTYGPNTAVYFCMDKLQVRSSATTGKPERPSSLNGAATETTINFSWANTNNSATVKGFNVYLNDELKAQVTDTKYLFPGLTPYTAYKLGVEAVNQSNIVSDRASVNVLTTDETAPTLPSKLSGIPTSNSIALTWEPSTDNVGIAEYNVYLNGIRKKKLTDTHYTLTGLAPGPTYTVEVEATDVAGNKSGKASVIVATTDETAPTTPSNLSAQPRENSVALSWTASNDDVGVTGYRIFVNDELYKTIGTTSVTVSELTASTNYIFSVAAFDAAGNLSAQASITVSTTDETAPTQPANLVNQISGTSVLLSWTASTDNVGVSGYRVYVNGQLFETTAETNITITGLNPEIQNTIAVTAFDAAGNQSGKTAIIISVNDQLPPTMPSGVNVQPSEQSILINWTASTDNIGVAGYNIYINEELQGYTNNTNYTVSGLYALTQYTLGIEAYDANGNKSDKALITAITTDETAPTPPGSIQTRVAETSVVLSWTASTDNVGITGYNIYLNDVLVNTTTKTSVTLNGLKAVTSYNLGVEAIDGAGNKSDKTTATVSTTDETAPTPPVNLNAVPFLNSVELSWLASADNVGVEKYQIYLNGDLYSATEIASFTVTGLTASTNYLVSVEAIDKAGNKSAKSTIQTATLTITGIGQPNKTDIKVYPNPFTDYIIVNLPFNEKVLIYNSVGQCKIITVLERGNNRIDVSTLPSGIYLVQIGEKTIKMIK